MPLIIHDAEIDALAHAVAAHTGESIEDAVRHALEARMAVYDVCPPEKPQERTAQNRQELLEYMESLARACAPHIHTPFSSTDVDDLYDEWGLPK
jgi:hypothetical protein